jgi:hypothetical protein
MLVNYKANYYVQGPTTVKTCFFCHKPLSALSSTIDWTTRKFHLGCLVKEFGYEKADAFKQAINNGEYVLEASLQPDEPNLSQEGI